MSWLEHSSPAMVCIIVPPREARYESPVYRFRMEVALAAAMPNYEFTVIVDHPMRQEGDAFFLDGDVDIETIQKITAALAPFIADRPPIAQPPCSHDVGEGPLLALHRCPWRPRDCYPSDSIRLR